MGNITSDKAFSFPLAEAQRRASRLASYNLSLKERILPLKTWVLPIVLLTSRACFPSDITIKTLKMVYNTALGVDSWGITLDQLSHELELGGYLLPTPKVWLHARYGTAGWVGGWGCYSAQGRERASYLPPHLRQTVNRAELQAVIEVLKQYCARH